ncbi:hypothetical protein BH24ACI3_BH24ACI3_13630 [soil metagenome]
MPAAANTIRHRLVAFECMMKAVSISIILLAACIAIGQSVGKRIAEATDALSPILTHER